MLVAAALSLGGNIRAGLEDNFYLPNGEMARSNGDLIAQAREMAEDVGRRPATVAEARELLGTPKRAARVSAGHAARRDVRVARPVPAPARRLLLAPARRLRRRGAQGRGHGDGRLHPLVAALLRGRGRLRQVGALPRAQPQQALDPPEPQGGAGPRGAAQAGRASTTCCSSRSVRACSTGWAWATSACGRRTRGLVYCAITGYGQDGPYRDRSGHDMNYLGLIGLLGPDRRDRTGRPIQSGGQIADIGGGALMAAFGILAALHERDALGRGPARRRLDGRRRAVVAGDGRRAATSPTARCRRAASSSSRAA